jgi:hypothetical protein
LPGPRCKWCKQATPWLRLSVGVETWDHSSIICSYHSSSPLPFHSCFMSNWHLYAYMKTAKKPIHVPWMYSHGNKEHFQSYTQCHILLPYIKWFRMFVQIRMYLYTKRCLDEAKFIETFDILLWIEVVFNHTISDNLIRCFVTRCVKYIFILRKQYDQVIMCKGTEDSDDGTCGRRLALFNPVAQSLAPLY